MSLVWFYKPPANGHLEPVLQNFDTFILTKNDEEVRDALRREGISAPFLQYLRFDTIHYPGSCKAEPLHNQVADQVGDYCRISYHHPEWFLLNLNGERMFQPDGDVMMDPGRPGWHNFWLRRARQSQEQLGWDGVFLDNVEASLTKRVRRDHLPAAYPDEASYQAAIEEFLNYIYSNYFKPEKRPLYANIIEVEDPDVWFRYLQYLDGAMEEAFAVGWENGYRSVSSWEEQLVRAEKTQALGKHIILVSQGAEDDHERQQFAFASYLLVNMGQASFRYGSKYDEAWLYSNYNLDLGRPLGARYREGEVWRRDFTNGSVSVDPAAHTATIIPR